MNLLAIETSTERASVALFFDGKVYQEEQGNIRQHAQLILPMIDKMLKKAGCLISQLDGIVFGRGPGSFTGLRIACSVAKGLAYAHDLPVYAVSGLQSIASEVYQDNNDLQSDTRVLTVIDARMKQIYWDCYSNDLRGVKEQVTAAEDVDLLLDVPLILAGFSFDEYISEFPETIRNQIIEQCRIYPDAYAMIRLVLQGHCEAISASDAQPIYVRNQVTHGGS